MSNPQKLSALALVAFAYILSLRWEPPIEEAVTSRWTSSDQGQPAEVVAHGWLPTNKIRYGEELRFWISLENRTESDVLNLRFVEFQAPGFREARKCWSHHAPACITEESPQPLPAVLKAHQTVTAWAYLAPVARSGLYSPSAVFAWSSPGVGEIRKDIALGPVEVTTWWREAILRFARRLHMLVRDLALPLLVVLLGLFFERREKTRETLRRRKSSGWRTNVKTRKPEERRSRRRPTRTVPRSYRPGANSFSSSSKTPESTTCRSTRV